jgi:gluconolactonase
LGEQPTLQLLIEDRRAPYFYSSGVFHPKSNTLFIASAPIPDSSPAAAPSRNLAVTLSKVEFFSAADFARDKVRTGDHTYMFQSGCVFGSGIVLCASGTLNEPAGLVYMETKRPHKAYSLLTNFGGTPLNSPHSCVSHPDGSIWFSDPHLSQSPSYRPKPKLPPLIYRFDPQTSDLRAMTDEIKRPSALAFSLNYKTLYVIDSGANPLTGCAIYAFTVLQPYAFLTQKRLFSLPSSPPKALAVDIHGNVYAACEDGIHVFNEGGSLIGKVLAEGVTGLCFGRGGQLWACAGEKLWKIQMDPSSKGAALRI